MLNILKKWYERNFHDEEAAILLLMLLAGVVVVLLLGEILAPVIAALVLAFLLQGVVAQLLNWRLSHLVAVTASSALLVLLLMLLLGLLLPLAMQQLANLLQELPALLVIMQEQLVQLPARYPAFITAVQINEWTAILSRELGNLGQLALSLSLSKIPNLFNLLIYIILIPVLVFFFLKDRELLLGWCSSRLPLQRPLLSRIWQEMNEQMANYVRGKALEMGLVGAVSYVVFIWFGLNYAALLAITVGLSVIIPYIGAFLVTVPVLLVAFLQWGWGGDFMLLASVYLLIQALDGYALVPMLFSETVNLHPVAILLAILLFGGLWGLWGVFFAIPLATLIKAVLGAWPKFP